MHNNKQWKQLSNMVGKYNLNEGWKTSHALEWQLAEKEKQGIPKQVGTWHQESYDVLNIVRSTSIFIAL